MEHTQIYTLVQMVRLRHLTCVCCVDGVRMSTEMCLRPVLYMYMLNISLQFWENIKYLINM